jgi:hypothetical protein
MRFTRHDAREQGRKDGLATLARYGPAHFATIGRRGFQVTTDRHFGGDRWAHLNELIRRGLRALDPCPWNGRWTNYTAFPSKKARENYSRAS